jgi:DNA-binding NarL/FixJ family response regulator
MPVMDGLEATRKMKALLPALSVLIFALDNSPQLEWESKQAGADAILAKAEGSTRLAGVIQSLAQRY